MLPNSSPTQSTASAEYTPEVAAVKDKCQESSYTGDYKASGSQTSVRFAASRIRNYYKKKPVLKALRNVKTADNSISGRKVKKGTKSKDQAKNDISADFILPPCCQEFKEPKKLFDHIKKRHHVKNAAKCSLCGRELSSKSSLDRHLLIHAKFQPYECSYCHKLFSTNGNLHRHEKSTHKRIKNISSPKFVKVENEETDMKSKGDIKPIGSKTSKIPKIKNQLVENAVIDKGFKNKRKYGTEERANDQVLKRMKRHAFGLPEDSINIVENESKVTEANNDIEATRLTQNESEDEVAQSQASISSNVSPSKQQFIATLEFEDTWGSDEDSYCAEEDLVKERCEEVKKKLSFVKNLENESSCEDVKLEKTVDEESSDVEENKKLVIDDDKEPNDFADITSILSNVRAQVGTSSNLSAKLKAGEISNSNLSTNSFNNTIDEWLLKSKEASVEAKNNCLVPASNDSLNTNLKKEIQQKAELLCHHCNESFTNKSILQKHLQKHYKSKPFKCKECGSQFLNKPNAIRHVVKVHKKSRDVAKTLIAYNLKDEPNAGGTTVCSWCGKDFTANIILEHHKRASIGCRAKPFLCLICNKSFSTKNNGKRHQTKHHNDESSKNCIVPNSMARRHETERSQAATLSVDMNYDTEGDTMNELSVDMNKPTGSDTIRTQSVLTNCDSGEETTCAQSDFPDSEMRDDITYTSSDHTNYETEDGMSLAESSINANSACDMNDLMSDYEDECTENDSVSNYLDSEIQIRSCLSSPKKREELEAAHSLIDMSILIPPHMQDKCKIYPHEQIDMNVQNNFNDTYASHSPFEKQKEISSQESPLDLSIRAMDLTSKSESSFSEEHNSFLSHSGCSDFSMVTPRKKNSSFSIEMQLDTSTETPLDLVKAKSPNIEQIDTFSMFHHQNISPQSIDFEVRDQSSNVDLRKSRNGISLENVKTTVVSCNICSMTFANNSNKRRHDKKKHPLQSPKAANSHFTPINIERKELSKPFLSRKTKEALITKVSSKPNCTAVEHSLPENSELTQPLGAINESENGDLASVSSLINTANSPQLKKFLTNDSNCDAVPNREEIPIDENNDGEKSPKRNKPKTKKSTKKYWCATCNKEFTCNSSFKRHSVIHTKERPYKCLKCNKTFTVKSNRDRHFKNTHPDPAEIKNMSLRKKQQKSSTAVVPSEPVVMVPTFKDLPLELVKSELSQCNKENQRLYMPS